MVRPNLGPSTHHVPTCTSVHHCPVPSDTKTPSTSGTPSIPCSGLTLPWSVGRTFSTVESNRDFPPVLKRSVFRKPPLLHPHKNLTASTSTFPPRTNPLALVGLVRRCLLRSLRDLRKKPVPHSSLARTTKPPRTHPHPPEQSPRCPEDTAL